MKKKKSFAQEKIGPAAIFLNVLFPALCNFEVQDVTITIISAFVNIVINKWRKSDDVFLWFDNRDKGSHIVRSMTISKFTLKPDTVPQKMFGSDYINC